MKNKDFILIRRYAVIFGMVVCVSAPAQTELTPLPIDTASTLTDGSTQHIVDTVLTRPELIRKINYAGAALSAFVPGSGQICQSRYAMGGLFLAAEATAVGFAVYWSGEADARRSDARQLRDFSNALHEGSGVAGIDSVRQAELLYEAGRYSVIADEAGFEAREARHTVYNALAWAAGLHLYNILDALEAGGLTARGREKNPTTAGFLAAVPFLALGQMYNERPSKAGMLAMTQAGLALTAYNQHRLMSIASGKYNQMRDSASAQYAYRAEYLNYWKSAYDNAFSDRNTYLWLSLAVYLYTIFDAVVDAYLSDFNTKIDIGTDLSAAPGGGGAAFRVTVGFK